MTNYFFCTKSHNFHLQAIDYPVAAGDIHKTALSLVWLTHWPRGPRVNVWESFSATEGYDLGWISSWHIQRAIKVFLMKSLSKQTKSLHTLWPSGPNASPTVVVYSNKCKKCTTHTLWLLLPGGSSPQVAMWELLLLLAATVMLDSYSRYYETNSICWWDLDSGTLITVLWSNT